MLTAFDLGVGVVVLISAILATVRGLTREVLSLLTWAGSAAIAVYMWHYHPEIARQWVNPPVVADVATVVVTFIVALIVLHLLTMKIGDMVVDSRIGPLDRTLGFAFGAARGLLIAVVVVIFGQWLMGNNLPTWAQDSKSLPVLASFGDGLIASLPSDLEQKVNEIMQRNGGTGQNQQAGGANDMSTDSAETPITPDSQSTQPPADIGSSGTTANSSSSGQ